MDLRSTNQSGASAPTTKAKGKLNEIQALLKELYNAALKCEYDGHKIKETLYPKYKGTRVKMNITEEGKFMFDSFGRYPDVVINLENMKKGKHTEDTIKEEIKKHILEAIPDASIEIKDLMGDNNHYSATIKSKIFKGMSKIEQHKKVYKSLKGKMGNELHALALTTEEK